jgi:pSer/pThr/pTyr-binding forkhead associated (FHA) protein
MASQARLVVQGSNATLPFPPGRDQIIIGREDPVSGIYPDIDLTDHGGDEGGVSRQHAQITTQSGQFYIEDLKSSNYTFVNRQKILPGQRQPLNNGDEIQLGAVKLTFQRM